MSNLEMTANNVNAMEHSHHISETLTKAFHKVLMYVPAAIIFGMIALYYISLSHLG